MTSLITRKRMLNIGCGASFHHDWVNIDFHDHGGAVLAYDLRLGIPFPDATADVIYHSHVLERFTRESGTHFLTECFRVLRPGGLLRIVVPDLENIVRAYLTALEDAKKAVSGAEERHQWMIIELIDQMVRTKSGGAMAEFWRRKPLPEEDFILSRSGVELVNFQISSRDAPLVRKQKARALPLPTIKGGELYRWMYDELSLRRLLEQAGFTGIERQAHDRSIQPDIIAYGLDAAPDGSIRRPHSLFMEALKPHTAGKAKAMPRVALLSTSDAGGAFTATLRQHLGLLDAGIRSHMYVAKQHGAARNLHVLPVPGQQVERQGEAAQLSGFNKAWQEHASALAAYPRRPQGLDMFSAGFQCALAPPVQLQEDFAVINVHWVANFFDVAANVELLQGRPLVLTLHDMRFFTGGCHYTGGCLAFTERCGQCPQLGSNYPEDLSYQTWRTQRAAYRKLDLHIVTPSAWLAGEAKKSSLLRDFPVRVIPNAHPLDLFRPLDRAAIRASLGCAPDDFVLLFVAQSLGNKRKGGSYLLEALRRLALLPLAAHTRLFLLGKNTLPDFFDIDLRIKTPGYVETPEEMAEIYNAADALLVPSLEDNLPNTICEALGCGTPVVAFAAGGIAEMIRDGETGRLAPVGDVAGLLAGIEWAASVKNDAKTRSACRAFAEESWSADARARDYAQLFQELAERRAVARKGRKK